MTDDESESKFDNLVSARYIQLRSQLITRVPSMKNMENLQRYQLSFNKITMIAAGDFKGAKSLLTLNLGGNSIVSVAISAFTNLELFRVRPEEFNPTNADSFDPESNQTTKKGTPWTNTLGIRTFVSNVCGRDLALQETPN